MFIESIETTEGESVELEDITALFGPNNTGKTQTLKDVLHIMGGGQNGKAPVIIDEISYDIPNSIDEWIRDISVSNALAPPHQIEISEIPPKLDREVYDQRIPSREWEEGIYQSFEQGHYQDVIDIIGPAKVFFLDAESRLSAAAEAKHQNIRDVPTSLPQVVHNDENKEKN